MPYWKKFLYAVVGRFLVALWLKIKYRTYLSPMFDAVVPFVGTDYPGFRLGLQRQWCVLDENGWVDTVYLVPSQRWIEEQVRTRFSTENCPDVYAEEARDFRNWVLQQIELNREVRYLVSLDT